MLLAGLSAAAGAASPISRAPADDPVVARIDDTEIRRSDLILAQQMMPAKFRKAPLKAVYPVLLKQVINTTLVVRAARTEGLDRTDAIRRRLAAIERRLIEAAYMERAAKGKVSNAAMRARYDAMMAASGGEEEVRVRHILVLEEAEATAIIKELGRGADFAILARSKSIGPSKTRAGDLGYVGRNAVVKPFGDAAFALKIGEVTAKPVKTRFGWHVIKLEDRRAAKTQSFEEMRPQLVRQIRARIASDIVKKMRRGATIVEFDINGKPMPKSASR
jgi:peptidyl-prolyl cis-trans isomerase C